MALESLARQSRQGAVGRDFDAENYSPDDAAFWSKFQELWERSGPEGSNALQPDPERTRKRRPVYRTRAARAARLAAQPLPAEGNAQQRSKRRQDWHLVHGQRAHLLRNTPDGDGTALALTSFRSWKRRLARTWAMLVRGSIPTTKETPVLRLLLQHEGLQEMRDAWHSLSVEKRRRVWPDVISSALRSKPEKVAVVFKATFGVEVAPSYAVQDLIHYLVRQPPGGKEPPADEAVDVLRFAMENSFEGYLRLRQRTLFMLVRRLHGPALADLHQLLVKKGHPLHMNTQLQFAGRLAEQAAYKVPAMAILESMVASTALDINSPRGLSLCTSLLTTKDDDAARNPGEAVPTDLFARLLQLGLRPNVITYTTIIRQLCRASRFHSAWDVFQLVLEQKIEPDAALYSTLLNGAKRAQDLDAVRQIVRLFLAQKISNIAVWNDFLHVILMAAFVDHGTRGTAVRRQAVPAFPLMLEAFTKRFRMASLQQLIGPGMPSSRTPVASDQLTPLSGWPFSQRLTPVVRELPQAPPDELLEPDTATLTIMVAGYLASVSKPYDIMVFYARFRRLVKEGHPAASRVVDREGTTVHDMVIKALCEWPGMIRVALDVVSDMLKSALATADVPKRVNTAGKTTKQTLQHPRPSVYTFSILLHAFMMNKQTGQAERILQMMKEQQIKPGRVTWNTLVGGYARSQNIQKTIWALRSMEGSGFTADEYTFKAFRYLRPNSQRRALDELEKSMARPNESQAGRSGPPTPLGAQMHELRRLEAEIDDMTKSLDATGGGQGAPGDDVDEKLPYPANYW